jgi:hypothetical protein
MGNRFLVPTVNPAGMTLLSTTTLSGASVTLSSIPQEYCDLRIIVRNFLPANDGVYLLIRMNGDSNAARHREALQYSDIGADAISYDNTRFGPGRGNDNTVTGGMYDFTIPDYTNTVTRKMMYGITHHVNQTTTTLFNHNTFRGYYNQTSAITSLEFLTNSGNFTSGTVLLYGVK